MIPLRVRVCIYWMPHGTDIPSEPAQLLIERRIEALKSLSELLAIEVWISAGIAGAFTSAGTAKLNTEPLLLGADMGEAFQIATGIDAARVRAGSPELDALRRAAADGNAELIFDVTTIVDAGDDSILGGSDLLWGQVHPLGYRLRDEAVELLPGRHVLAPIRADTPSRLDVPGRPDTAGGRLEQAKAEIRQQLSSRIRGVRPRRPDLTQPDEPDPADERKPSTFERTLGLIELRGSRGIQVGHRSIQINRFIARAPGPHIDLTRALRRPKINALLAELALHPGDAGLRNELVAALAGDNWLFRASRLTLNVAREDVGWLDGLLLFAVQGLQIGDGNAQRNEFVYTLLPYDDADAALRGNRDLAAALVNAVVPRPGHGALFTTEREALQEAFARALEQAPADFSGIPHGRTFDLPGRGAVLHVNSVDGATVGPNTQINHHDRRIASPTVIIDAKFGDAVDLPDLHRKPPKSPAEYADHQPSQAERIRDASDAEAVRSLEVKQRFSKLPRPVIPGHQSVEVPQAPSPDSARRAPGAEERVRRRLAEQSDTNDREPGSAGIATPGGL